MAETILTNVKELSQHETELQGALPVNNYEKLIEQCDTAIRAGQDQIAIRLITQLDITKIPRNWRLPVAKLCRRVALIPIGLKILSSIVSPTNKKTLPSGAEVAEYASLLQKFGAVDDALWLLNEVHEREVPESLMYRAVCHFTRWEYEKAIPLLEKYIAATVNPYQVLIGKVNLAAALFYTQRFDDAEKLLIRNIHDAQESNSARLEGNCREMLTNVHLLNMNLSAARKCLEEAESLIAGHQSLDRLYTNMCRAFLTALETESVSSLIEFRKEAAAWPHAETVRETDLYILMIKNDIELYEQLYFGTPFRLCRDRMELFLKKRPEKTEFVVGSEGGARIDLCTGRNSDAANIKVGSLIHRVLNALLLDSYRPVRFGSLFGYLYPGEHFDIHTSPVRVHQALRRARMWIKENNLPLEIVESAGVYSLQITGKLAFRLPAERSHVSRDKNFLSQLSSEYPNEMPFTCAAVCDRFGLTASTFYRLIGPILESGEAQKFGAAQTTVYFISPKAAKSA
jgi:hypothetical protein